jgi:hypothetical protein
MLKLNFAFVFCFLFVAQAYAQSIGNVVLFTQEGERFWVILNGERQNQDPQTNVKINDLRAPMYKMKIIFEDKTIADLDKNLYLEEGNEVTMNIRKNNKGKYDAKYITSVPVEQATREAAYGQYVMTFGQQVAATGLAGGTSQTTTIQNTTTTVGSGGNLNNNQDNNNISINLNLGGLGVGMATQQQTGVVQQQQTTTTTTQTTSGSGMVYQAPPPMVFVPGYNGRIGCAVPIAPAEFDRMVSSVKNKSFEATMAETAKTITKKTCLTVSQVEEMIDVFSFENTKLDYLKFAFKYTYDMDNYYRVADKLTYSNSQSELLKYIDNK